VLELLVRVRVPVAVPATVGSKDTCSLMATVGFKVTGKVAPEIVNPVPVRLAELTVTADVPVELKVTYWVVAVPTGVLPKFKLVELNVSTGFPTVAAPVPLRLTVTMEVVEELVAIARDPVAAPATVGSKLS